MKLKCACFKYLLKNKIFTDFKNINIFYTPNLNN